MKGRQCPLSWLLSNRGLDCQSDGDGGHKALGRVMISTCPIPSWERRDTDDWKDH